MACDDSGSILQSLGDGDLANVILKAILHPQTEWSDFFFWKSASFNRLHLTVFAKIFLDILEVGLNTDQPLALVFSILLEKNLIDIVGQDQDINFTILERLHVW